MMGNFRKDDRVSHARHGAGIVINTDERYTIIEFDDGGVRKLVTTSSTRAVICRYR
jgi:hypothetical protein